MPLLKKQTNDAKKRLQHQLYLARECPDPIFDISSCELTEIPSGVFSLCKVLQKESLLLHNNWLAHLNSGGNFVDLASLRILDLHDNELVLLPKEVGLLKSLQVLNLEHNQLKSLPNSISSLTALQTLNVRNNVISEVPEYLCHLCSLRILDISQNCVVRLPKQLSQIKTLETLNVDESKMKFPPAEICSAGTESIMQFLCAESWIEYVPPSKVLLNVLPVPQSSSTSKMDHDTTDLTLSNTVMQYENLKEKKRLERMALEHQLNEDQRQQVVLAAEASSNKKHLMQFVAQEQARMDQEIMAAHQRKLYEREKLTDTLYLVEKNASELLSKLMKMNEKARKSEELLEQMEKERMEQEQWYSVRQEELLNIRRKDIVASMEQVLKHNDMFGCMIQKYLSNQDATVMRTKQSLSDVDDQVELVLNSKEKQKHILLQRILKEESLQMEAFEVLQYQKDFRHKRITSQILLIEQELAELTFMELEQRSAKLDEQMNILEEKRRSLTELLLQLFAEKDKREKELHARLMEMEARKLENQTDFWLVQYQRLLDSKPLSLIDQENNMEVCVVKILNLAGAADYLPQFSRHRITIETLLQMSDDDLIRIGVHELGLRQSIRKHVQEFKLKEQPDEKVDHVEPTAPSSESQDGSTENIDSTIVTRGINSECVICMEGKSTVLFLNCGHVCTCKSCSSLIHECPLDRCQIVRKVHLSMPTGDDTQHGLDSVF